MSKNKGGRPKIHGLTDTHFYRKWKNIQNRITNKKRHNYSFYGKRGIKNLWKSFIEFKNDMYKSYLVHVKTFGEKQTTLDRIDNNGNYGKNNCRWATYKEQNNNTSRNKK